ncbi:MAG: YwbE family protein [Lachnospiraceae bacterium]|nr:YwbE family protein [Lachnospiraceae bacterium]
MINQERKQIELGATVDVVLKEDQPTGKLTRGTVKRILTKNEFHPRGIKVELEDGAIGRVQHIIN